MSTALDHPIVAGYLHELDIALASLPPGAAAELSEQLRAHLLEALPDGADDATISEVLAELGPARLVALAAAEPGSGRARQLRRRPPLPRRTVALARRVPMRIWISAAVLAVAVGAPAGTLIYWQTQPEVTFDGGSSWWSPQHAERPIQTEADGATQSTIPLRPGQIQGFEIFVYNPSDTSQRILGAPAGSISPGAPVPPQIDVSTTGSWQLGGEPDSVAYEAGGTIPPHSYRWLRVQWRSYQCYLEGPGGSQGMDRLMLRVKVGWITRTEVIPLPTEFAVSPITKWPAWCNGRPSQP
jgi:HAAS domain-containing protein